MKTLLRPADTLMQPCAPAGPTSDVRVLHVITGMQRGGAEKVVMQLAVSRGDRAAVAWLKGANAWESPFEGSSVTLQALGVRGVLGIPRAVRELSRVIRRFRPDIVHTHLLHAHVVGRWAARRVGSVPVVSTEHNLRVYARADQKWLQSLDLRSSRQSAAIVAISRAARDRCLSMGFRGDTLHVVYNGVDVPAEVPPSPSGRRPVITMVGRLRAAKGADLFLRAVDLIPDADAILVGDGEDRPLIESLIGRLNHPDRLTFLPQGDAMEAMAAANIVVMPSRHEGLGLVALEAMSIERPVVATRVGGLVEVVEDNVTGRLVNPESPESLAGAVSDLLADPSLMRSMGQAGRRRVEENFTLQRMIEGYEGIYDSVAKKDHGRNRME